jgi:hypothetical protein
MRRNAHDSPPSTSGGGELRTPRNGDQNPALWTPSRTAANEISRPIPQNRAIETNWCESDFLETSSDFEIGVETRMAVGMSGSKTFAFNSPPNKNVLAGAIKVQQRDGGWSRFILRL